MPLVRPFRQHRTVAAGLLLLVALVLGPGAAAAMEEKDLRALLDVFAEQSKLEAPGKPPAGAVVEDRSARGGGTPPQRGDVADALAYRTLSLQRVETMLATIGLLMPYLNLEESLSQSRLDLDERDRKALDDYRAQTEKLARGGYQRLGGKDFDGDLALLKRYASDINHFVLPLYRPKPERKIDRESGK